MKQENKDLLEYALNEKPKNDNVLNIKELSIYLRLWN